MMMRFSKFLKVEADIVVARHALVMDETKSKAEPVIFLHPEFAKRSGVKEGDVVEVEANGRTVKLRAKLSENAPENGGIMPNGIFASYLTGFDGFKRFKANIEVAEGEPTSFEEILEKIKG
ncbi:tungsten formylmethanofuran dehydrogenase, subunit D (fwdD-1) [Archaeoglobus fulgidus DSM 4304]|uniref:Tungsten formylmethanofuran dehydrogenase, subunit D (FwdD-1) n=3 Tax=Archaeoglobus fulgidus TaxID=2234 RepID=O28622_ARCFU|nr:tungsten formylmethanofuran dehydrogenase, subunit D (fwdD-1) [Archaeoglobus fulgidus DSM 4304]